MVTHRESTCYLRFICQLALFFDKFSDQDFWKGSLSLPFTLVDFDRHQHASMECKFPNTSRNS